MPANPNYPELAATQGHWRYQPAANCLQGKNILVTGAGSGIGATAAKTYACYGANVLLLGRTRSHLESVFDWIEANTDTQAVIIPCDLRALNDDSAQALVAAVVEGYGQLDGLLHCASTLGPKVPIAHYPPEQWAEVMHVNATAPFVLTHALLPLMLDHPRRASIVFVSSTVGRQGRAYWGAYAASKHALEGLMEVLADEHETAGNLRVNSINPGATRTAMRALAYPGENPADVPTAETKMDVFVYLMDDTSENLTGAALDARDWAGPNGE